MNVYFIGSEFLENTWDWFGPTLIFCWSIIQDFIYSSLISVCFSLIDVS